MNLFRISKFHQLIFHKLLYFHNNCRQIVSGFIWPHTMRFAGSRWPAQDSLSVGYERERACLSVSVYLLWRKPTKSLSFLPPQPHKQASGQNHYAAILQFIQCLQLLISFCLLHKEGTLSEAVSKELTGASSSIWTLAEETFLTTGHCWVETSSTAQSQLIRFTEAKWVRYSMPDADFHM